MNKRPKVVLSHGVRALKADAPPVEMRKDLGQWFTGPTTGRLLAALAVEKSHRRILDPMAGDGDLLESAAARSVEIGQRNIDLRGVEIDPVHARTGEKRIGQLMRRWGLHGGSVRCADSFNPATWSSEEGYDLVIANPPFVRYQTLHRGVTSHAHRLAPDTIRTRLLVLADRMANSQEREIWKTLIRSYSGHADLAVPSLILCGLLTAPGGTLAFVAPQTLLSRNYAIALRYLLLRCFNQDIVVRESGQCWFPSAQVPVGLFVFSRLHSSEAIVPVLDRRTPSDEVLQVDIEPIAATKASHVGASFRAKSPECAFAMHIRGGGRNVAGIQVRRPTRESVNGEIIELAQKARWYGRVEMRSARNFWAPRKAAMLPQALIDCLPKGILSEAKPLEALSINVGQGLRTGCNSFFYVDVIGPDIDKTVLTVRTSNLFSSRTIEVPNSILLPVLRRQKELSGPRIDAVQLTGRVLNFGPNKLPGVASKGGRTLAWPSSLVKYVYDAAFTEVASAHGPIPIPELSAVRTNRTKGDSTIQRQSREWYTLPELTDRHVAEVCIPRVISDRPIVAFNSSRGAVIDANFSTVWGDKEKWSGTGLYAILVSTWAEMCMEAIGSTMGGGALKLEATHLRRLPLPELTTPARQTLAEMGREILRSRDCAGKLSEVRCEIDQVVMEGLLGRPLRSREYRRLDASMQTIIDELRLRRTQRKQGAGKVLQ